MKVNEIGKRPERVVVTVSGGVVTAVHSTNPELTVQVLDYDNMEATKADAAQSDNAAADLEEYEDLEAAIWGMAEVY